MTRLVLASGSPRRQAFLAALGLAFTVEVADVDETAAPGEQPDELVCRLSRSKAQTVAARQEANGHGAAVLAADTVVVLAGEILGKPCDADDAVRMLTTLRGRVHQVYTAVSLATPDSVTMQLCRSHVWMRAYSDGEIAAYVATGDPLDKAGAYAIQHPLFSPVERWEGCYAGIMGLPLGVAANLLAQAGLPVPPATVLDVCERASGTGHCCLRSLPSRC